MNAGHASSPTASDPAHDRPEEFVRTVDEVQLHAAASHGTSRIERPRALLTFSPWMLLGRTSQRGADESFHDAVMRPSFADLAAPAWRGDLPVGDPQVAPLDADLAGLPPTLVHVGGDEVLLEDSLRLADRLAMSSVQVELRVFPGMPHVFPAYPTLAPECDQSLAAAAAFLVDASTSVPRGA